VESLSAHAAEKDYLSVEGLEALCASVAGYHARVDGVPIKADGVLVGPGSKELLFLAQLAFGGDLVLPAPCWVSYRPQAQIIGKTIVRVPSTKEARWRVNPEALDTVCADGAPRMMILNYPGNPDGLTYTTDELQAIAAVCRRRNVIVVSDEIYGPLDHQGQHVSLARFYPEGTIISGGLSKWCGAGGWRLGTHAFPTELRWLQQAMATVASETYTSGSAPIQYAAVTAFDGGPEIDAYLTRARAVLRALSARIIDTLHGAGIGVHPPTGAFYIMLDFSAHQAQLASRGITDSLTLCEQLLEDTGVAILAGANFEQPPEVLTARLAYVDFDGTAALQHTGSDVVDACCPRVAEGVERLAAWLR